MTGGSFPRSFLIPGTDTSIRVGGEIRMLTVFWINGGNPNGSEATTNAGTTGQLNNIPLSGLSAGFDRAIARERSDNVLNMSPQQSKLSVETRTPTAWGEARTFLEFDFAGDTAASARPMSAANSLQPRLRYAYGTIGPLLFGQANSNFNDSDAGMESLAVRRSDRRRRPGPRAAAPLDAAAWRVGPAGRAVGLGGSPRDGDLCNGRQRYFCRRSDDRRQSCRTHISRVGCRRRRRLSGDSRPITAGTCNVTVANPLKNSAPEMVAAWYIPQPWGHVDFARLCVRISGSNSPSGPESTEPMSVLAALSAATSSRAGSAGTRTSSPGTLSAARRWAAICMPAPAAASASSAI